MKITAEPRSDQWNADDFLGGPRVFEISSVNNGAAEQKYDIGLMGENRVWRPPLSMIRVLLAVWGDESDAWVGRRVQLFHDPNVRFGKEAVGGIRIAALSHLDKPLNLKLTATRGKRVTYTVQPLPDAPRTTQPARDFLAEAEQAGGDRDLLRALWTAAKDSGESPETLAQIQGFAAAENAPKSPESSGSSIE